MGAVWALSLVGLVLLLMTLVLVDQVTVRTRGRSWLPWRRNRTTHAVMSTGLDQVTALFYATKHFELEHRKTEIMLRAEVDDRAPRFRLDLDRPDGLR